MESQETIIRLSQLRTKAESGQKLTMDEQAEVVRLVRADRLAAAVQTKAKKSAAPKADPAETLKKLQDLLGRKT